MKEQEVDARCMADIRTGKKVSRYLSRSTGASRNILSLAFEG